LVAPTREQVRASALDASGVDDEGRR